MQSHFCYTTRFSSLSTTSTTASHILCVTSFTRAGFISRTLVFFNTREKQLELIIVFITCRFYTHVPLRRICHLGPADLNEVKIKLLNFRYLIWNSDTWPSLFMAFVTWSCLPLPLNYHNHMIFWLLWAKHRSDHWDDGFFSLYGYNVPLEYQVICSVLQHSISIIVGDNILMGTCSKCMWLTSVGVIRLMTASCTTCAVIVCLASVNI